MREDVYFDDYSPVVNDDDVRRNYFFGQQSPAMQASVPTLDSRDRSSGAGMLVKSGANTTGGEHQSRFPSTDVSSFPKSLPKSNSEIEGAEEPYV